MASRTWVSGVGDDANPGSRTAPCKTFAGAISKTGDGGEIDVLDPGGFGALTITKSITIDGTGTFASVLAAGTSGITINGAGINVTLRALSITGQGTGLNGIHIVNANKVHIEDCEISGFNAGAGRGISDERTTGGLLFVTNTTVRDNNDGIVIRPSAGATGIQAFLDYLRITGQVNAGLIGSSGTRVTISKSLVAWNINFGLLSESPAGGTAEMDTEDCRIIANNVGVHASASATVRLSNLHVVGNTVGLQSPGTFVTFGNNKVAGNGSGNAVPGGPPVTQPI